MFRYIRRRSVLKRMADEMIRQGRMPTLQHLYTAVAKARGDFRAKILAVRRRCYVDPRQLHFDFEA